TKAVLELRHTGAAASYSADGRIVSINDGSPNPAPSSFQCQLLYKGLESSPRQELRDAEWAQIVIASIETSQVTEKRWLAVRRGRVGVQTQIPDAGALIEFGIRSSASPQQLLQVRIERR